MDTPSLLITDDDAAFRQTLGGVFSPKGFRILLAGDGEEALEIIGHEEVHLVLLDIHMPRLSGLDTLRRLREFKFRSPCILLSGAGTMNCANKRGRPRRFPCSRNRSAGCC